MNLPRFPIGVTVRKIKRLLVSEKKKALQLLLSNIGTGFHIHINDNCQSLFTSYDIRSKIALDLSLRKTNTKQQVFSFWGTKI